MTTKRFEPSGPERRFLSGIPGTELRAIGEDGEPAKIVGHAAVFNVRSEPLSFGGFRFVEEIAPGAFSKTLLEADVRALWNHDANFPLGRNRAGTLRLSEDDTGLYYEIDPPNTTYANDLIESIRRGDVSGSSFAFRVVKESWTRETNEQTGVVTEVRRLLELQLHDVSPVTYPAYTPAESGLRSLGAVLSQAPRETIEAAIADLRGLIADSEPLQPGHSLDVVAARRRLRLTEIAAGIT